MMKYSDLVNKNIKTLTWWANYYSTANDWFDKKIGDIINVSIYDVMPNLRMFHNVTGCEFEINNQISYSSEIIEVFIDKKSGVLIIEDGHHRFNEAIKRGDKRIDVKITSMYSAERILLSKISDEEFNSLKI